MSVQTPLQASEGGVRETFLRALALVLREAGAGTSVAVKATLSTTLLTLLGDADGACMSTGRNVHSGQRFASFAHCLFQFVVVSLADAVRVAAAHCLANVLATLPADQFLVFITYVRVRSGPQHRPLVPPLTYPCNRRIRTVPTSPTPMRRCRGHSATAPR